MIGLNTYTTLSFSLFILIHIDYLINFSLTKLWFLNKQETERAVIQKKTELTENQTNYFWLYLVNILLITTKFSLFNYFNLFIYCILIIYIQFIGLLLYITKLFKKQLTELKFLNFILQIIFFIFFSLAFIDNFLSFFFLMEILAISYYFFLLLSVTNKLYTNINQYKNLLILYLWNSFWTSLLFIIFLLSLIFYYNTLLFVDIKLLWTSQQWILPYFFFFSIFLKLGLPFFHFFKMQIYYLLDIKLIFFYSIITTYANLCFLLIISHLELFNLFIENSSIFVIFLIGSFFLLVNSFKTWTIFNLFLYSAITTFIVFVVLLF